MLRSQTFLSFRTLHLAYPKLVGTACRTCAFSLVFKRAKITSFFQISEFKDVVEASIEGDNCACFNVFVVNYVMLNFQCPINSNFNAMWLQEAKNMFNGIFVFLITLLVVHKCTFEILNYFLDVKLQQCDL